MATIVDDRTDEQLVTHSWLVIGTDRILSGWGGASGGYSYAAWACRPDDRAKVLHWVSSRTDMKRVREAGSNYRPSGACAHLHIYVVDENHPSLA